MVHLADATAPDTNGFFEAVALEVFDRWGRGILASEHVVRFDVDVAEQPLGAEILNALPQLPNHNRRLGDDPSADQPVLVCLSGRGDKDVAHVARLLGSPV